MRITGIMQFASAIGTLAEEVGLKVTPTYNGQLPLVFDTIQWTIQRDGKIIVTTQDVHSVLNILEIVHQEHYGLS